MKQTTRTLLSIAAILTGFTLRLHHLAAKDLWWDEAHSWWYATRPFTEGVLGGMTAWHGAAGDPLYTILLDLWITFTGDSIFAMRTLSALASILSAAALARITGRAFGRPTGTIALLIGALAPAWIFYAQEVRQYALIPLLMLLILDGLIDLYPPGGWQRKAPWIKIATGEALALYTHGFMAFAVLGVNLLLVWAWFRDYRTRPHPLHRLRNWALSQTAALLLLAPAIPTYIRRTQAETLAVFTPLPPADMAHALWSLLLGIPWEHSRQPTLLLVFSALVLLLFLPGLALTLRWPGGRRRADLTWLLLLSTSLPLVYWRINPAVHPRYMLFASAMLFPLLATFIAEGWRAGKLGQTYSLTLAASLLLICALNLANLYTGREIGYRHDPAQAVSQTLQTTLSAADGVVSTDPADRTLAYYGTGLASLFYAGFDEGHSTPADLLAFLDSKQQIALVRFHAERSDTRQIAAFYLERYGTLLHITEFDGYTIATYRLDPDADFESVTAEPALIQWEQLALTGFSLHASDAVTLALDWQTLPTFTPTRRYGVLARLVDPQTGWLLSQATAPLLLPGGVATEHWTPNQTATQYLVLPLLPGTPPLTAEIQLTLIDATTGEAFTAYDAHNALLGQRAPLTTATLGPAPLHWAYSADRQPFHLTPVDSPWLQAWASDWPTSTPGGEVGLTLQWLAAPDALTAADVRLQLLQGDLLLAEDSGPALQGRPPADLPAGTPWLDRRLLTVSNQAQSGLADLVLWLDQTPIPLGQIEILGFTRLTEPPAIAVEQRARFGDKIMLLGYQLDAPDPLTASDTVMLTLYWQALADGAPEDNLTVFVHMLGAEGQIVGQHDGIPAYGVRPASGWQAGEYIIDEHPLQLNQDYTGPVTIQIGFYDPATFARLPIDDGTDTLPLQMQPITIE